MLPFIAFKMDECRQDNQPLASLDFYFRLSSLATHLGPNWFTVISPALAVSPDFSLLAVSHLWWCPPDFWIYGPGTEPSTSFLGCEGCIWTSGGPAAWLDPCSGSILLNAFRPAVMVIFSALAFNLSVQHVHVHISVCVWGFLRCLSASKYF